MILVAGLAAALTLEDVARRAGEVDPSAVVAELTASRVRSEAATALADLGPTPSVTAGRTWAADSVTDGGTFHVSLPLVDPPGWFDAAEQVAQARGATRAAEATRLDAQYAAAGLYYEVLAAEAGREAARATEAFARGTLEAVDRRVAAGLDSELAEKSARLRVLSAEAAVAGAEADVEVARAQLERAIEAPVDTLVTPELPELPAEAGRSPWLEASAAAWAASKDERGQRLAELFPTGTLRASTSLFGTRSVWAVSFSGTWSFDGVVGPFLRFHQAGLDQDIARVQYEALERDLALGLVTARARARAADRVAEAALARRQLADEAVEVGQKRLDAGLTSSLELLRLQDDAATARADHVAADLARALTRLEARRIAGIPW